MPYCVVGSVSQIDVLKCAAGINIHREIAAAYYCWILVNSYPQQPYYHLSNIQ